VSAPSRTIIFAPAARDEFYSAAHWYEEKRRGLGNQFMLMVEAKLGAISKSPEVFPLVYQQFHRALVRRFPFAIYFELLGDTVHILAIHHTRRLPPSLENR